MNYSFLYRNYTEWRGMFFDGKNENLIYTQNAKEANAWWTSNQNILKKVSIVIPPKKTISFMIPIVESWEIDEWFYDFVYDKKTDSVLSGILEIFLKSYVPVVWGKFMKSENNDTRKYDSINLEKFQVMKDIIMGRFRITPIKIPIWKEKWSDDEKYYNWEIGSNSYDVEYEYKWTKYKTNHFWIYMSNFRRCMFQDSDDYEFYGGHTMQYRQRLKQFESWYVTYTNACRWLGKSISENFSISADLVREKVFKWERIRPLLNLYYGATKEEVTRIFQYALSMYRTLLTSIWWEKLFKRFIHYANATGTLTINDWTEKRTIVAISENQSGRWSRPSYVTWDEIAKFKKADEVIKEILWFGKCPVSFISTVKSDTERNEFYDNWSSAYKNMKKYNETMFDIIHDIWWKYWIWKCKKPEDYLELAKEWVFDRARAELFRRRPLVWLKYTIDDGELKTEEEKDMETQALLDNSWYGAVMAEFYWVVLSDRSVFKFSGNIVDKLPHELWKSYQHMYFSYDEADESDNPAVVVWGISEWKLYIVDSVKLTADLTKRYEDMKQLYEKRKYYTLWWVSTVIADVNRWQTIREKMVEKLGKLDIPFKFTRSAAKEDWKIWEWSHIVNKWWLVKLLQNEYLPKGKVLIWSSLNNEWWLLEEMSNYVDKWGGKYEWDKKKKDDQITAMLQIIYAAHLWFFQWVLNLWLENLDYIDYIHEMEKRKKAEQKQKELMNNKRSVINKYF